MTGGSPFDRPLGYSPAPSLIPSSRNRPPPLESVTSHLPHASGPRLPLFGGSTTSAVLPTRQTTGQEQLRFPYESSWPPGIEGAQSGSSSLPRLSQNRTPSMPSLLIRPRQTNTDAAGNPSFTQPSLATSSRYVPPAPEYFAQHDRRANTGFHSTASSDSPVDIQLDADSCIVCGSDNGPWRRGPLGVGVGLRLCNSCGHIKGSSLEADNYDHAMMLLENLRLARLARVRRRPESTEVTELLQRLQRLPARTLRLARSRFPSDVGTSTRDAFNTRFSLRPAISRDLSHAGDPNDIHAPEENRFQGPRLRRTSGLQPLNLSGDNSGYTEPGIFDSRLATAPPLRRRASMLNLPPLRTTYNERAASEFGPLANQPPYGDSPMSPLSLSGPSPDRFAPHQSSGLGRLTTDPSAYALASYRGPTTAMGLPSENYFSSSQLPGGSTLPALPPLQLPPLTTTGLSPFSGIGNPTPFGGIAARARATHSSSRLPQLPFRGRGRGYSDSAGYPPI